MVRKIAGVLIVLLGAGVAVAAQDDKDAKKDDYPTVIGTFESYKDEVLTLKVLKENKETKFKVPGNTDVGYATGKGEPKVEKAKEHLKDVKKGAFVSLTLDKDGKKVLAVGVLVSELPKGKRKEKDEGSDK